MLPHKNKLLPTDKIIKELKISNNFEDHHKLKLYSL